jgi:hypothetical protein
MIVQGVLMQENKVLKNSRILSSGIIWYLSSVADSGIYQRGGSTTIKYWFSKAKFHYYLWFFNGVSTLQICYFYPILTKFSDKKGGGVQLPEPPLWICQLSYFYIRKPCLGSVLKLTLLSYSPSVILKSFLNIMLRALLTNRVFS